MTYQTIIQRFLDLLQQHKFINETGYGNLSDIQVPEDQKPPDYPYAFINPIDMTAGSTVFSVTFNLIVMTQMLEGQPYELEGQSNCAKYINDIAATFIQTNQDPLMTVVTPITMIPFKERFQDNVVGATATITVNYARPMDVCDSPLSVWLIQT